jgi:hypothetical protein
MNYADEKHNKPMYERVKEGHVTHSMWCLAVDPKTFSPDAAERCVEYTYIEFIDTIVKMLRLTRLLSFS